MFTCCSIGPQTPGRHGAQAAHRTRRSGLKAEKIRYQSIYSSKIMATRKRKIRKPQGNPHLPVEGWTPLEYWTPLDTHLFCIKRSPQKISPISRRRFGTFSSRGRSTAVAVRTSGLALREMGSRCRKSTKTVFGSSKIHGNVINNGFFVWLKVVIFGVSSYVNIGFLLKWKQFIGILTLKPPSCQQSAARSVTASVNCQPPGGTWQHGQVASWLLQGLESSWGPKLAISNISSTNGWGAPYRNFLFDMGWGPTWNHDMTSSSS